MADVFMPPACNLDATSRSRVVSSRRYRGVSTQNSLPSGSAITTQLTSPWPMSIGVAPSATRRSTSALLAAAGGRSDVEMEPVLAELRHQRRPTPGDHRTGEVGRANRGLFVLIPDQRPSQRLAPEVADRPRAIAVDRSQTWACREEVVGRLDDAELVALGIGEHDMCRRRGSDRCRCGGRRGRSTARPFRPGHRATWSSGRDEYGSGPTSAPRPARRGSRSWCHRSARDRARHRFRRRSTAVPRPRSAPATADRSHRGRAR